MTMSHTTIEVLCTTLHPSQFFFFFFNDTATTEIYTLSLHDALPILGLVVGDEHDLALCPGTGLHPARQIPDRDLLAVVPHVEDLAHRPLLLGKERGQIGRAHV